jgi:hypothetical protein
LEPSEAYKCRQGGTDGHIEWKTEKGTENYRTDPITTIEQELIAKVIR